MTRRTKAPDYSPEEAMARFDAALKKALNVTGPRVSVNQQGGIEVDLNDIVKRGKDACK